MFRFGAPRVFASATGYEGTGWPTGRATVAIDDELWRVGDRFLIDFWHPANRYPGKLNYYSLIAQLQGAGAFEDVTANRDL